MVEDHFFSMVFAILCTNMLPKKHSYDRNFTSACKLRKEDGTSDKETRKTEEIDLSGDWRCRLVQTKPEHGAKSKVVPRVASDPTLHFGTARDKSDRRSI